MRRNELALLPKLPLLITESAEEFDALRDAFEREIKPQGIIEQLYPAVLALRVSICNPGTGWLPLAAAARKAPLPDSWD